VLKYKSTNVTHPKLTFDHILTHASTGDWISFMTTVEWLATNEPKAPLPGPFRFEMSQDAIHHNSMVLKDNDYELDKVISKYPNSLISPGSELRPMNHLELLLGNHPNFPQIKQNLKHGVDYPAEDLPEDLRLSLLQEQLKKGNHKSALTNEAKPIVDKLVHQDVNLGYAIPLSRDCLLRLKGAELYPMGLQHQLTIDDNGNQIPKKRVTHDLSNKRKDGTSINQRVDETKVPGTMYGFALQRFLILVHHIRYHHPNKRILMCKSDFDKAYRRIHTTARIASKCLSAWELPEEKEDNQTQHDRFTALLMTRLPFGSAPAPPEFSIFSEPIFDLACDLMMCPYWDPTKLPSPYASKLEEPIRYKDNTPFGKALEPDVHLPPHQICGSEGYIDDGALAVLDTEKTHKMVKRAHQALGMASHLVFRPNTKNEPIERPDPQSLRKMNAEGRLREHMIFLGWRIDSREFVISLPDEKVRAWTSSINNTLTKLTINFEDSQTLVGRLNHVGYIIPTARHFLNRIRKLEYLADKRGHAKINDDTAKDLKLWIELLQRAKAGISINSVIFRRPTSYTISDASEHGVGGYCLRTGKAWRYKFKTHEAAALTLNLKEFIGSIINGMIFLPLDPSPQPCLLSIGDSTSAAGWLHKSNFDPHQSPAHAEAARSHARNIMKHNASDYSQHLPGLANVIADVLSRDFHLSNEQLISMLHSTSPPLLPPQLTIIDIPENIITWIGSLAQLLPKRKESPSRPTISTLARGISGWSSNENATYPTPIWTTSDFPKKYTSSAHSCMPIELDHFLRDESKFRGPLLARPSTTWQRPLLQVVGLTQRRTDQEKQTSD